MKVFEFAVQEGYEWVLPVDEADFRIFRRFDGSPRLSGWVPLRMRLVTTDENGRRLARSDMPWLGAHAPVFRARALSVLAPLIASDGEMLPLDCSGTELVVFNATNILPALDLERSRIVRFPSSGRIMNVESFAFREETLAQVRAFKVPELLNDAVFVTQAVVDAAQAGDLQGVGFKLIWDDAPVDLSRRSTLS